MTFCTYGDLGDIIYLCPSMKLVAEQSGEPVTLYAKDGLRPWDPITERLVLIRRLLEVQDYIEAVFAWDEDEIDHDASMFRDGGHPFGVTLATLQARWLGMSPDLQSPWLDVSAADNYRGKIVINRSPRYHNVFFPWGALVEQFGNLMLFIGHPHECHVFCQEFGPVEYQPTEDLLQAARIIRASELFIGNQSSCYAIAEGLKHRSIQETDLSTPDCIYPRANAIHCHDGALDFSVGGKHFTSKSRLLVKAHLNETPPGGWTITVGEHSANSYAYNLTLAEITAKLQRAGLEVPENLKELMIEQNSLGFQDHPVTRLIAA